MYTFKIFKFIILNIVSILIFTNISLAKNLDLKIIGNKYLDKEFIQSIVDTNIDLNDEELINYIIKELFSSGYFESVTAEIKDNILTINLIENPVINKIVYTGNNRFKDKDLNKAIKIKLIETEIYNQYIAEDIKNTLIQQYKSYGFNLIDISYETENLENGQINLNFNINEGEVTKIKKINIIGNDNISNRKIKSVIRSSESRFYKIFSSSHKYNENLIYLDEKKIEEYYLNKGFKNISVTSSISEFIKDKNQVIISYFIEEGKKYKINNIEIIFDEKIDNSNVNLEGLISDLYIKKNKTYNKSKIEKSSNSIYNFLQKQGMIFIDVNPIENEDDNLVNLEFLVSEINEAYISEINISGNVRTKDRVIRREMELSEGDPFVPSKIKKSRSNIRNLNFFSKVDVSAKSISNDRVKVDIEIEEKPTGEFNIGLAYDSYADTTLMSGLRENNIFGDGRYLALNLNASSDNTLINFEVVEPYIKNKNFNLIYNLDLSTDDFTSSSGYKKDIKTIGVGARYDLTDNISHYIKLDYAIEDFHSITSSASNSISNKEGENVEWYLTNRLSQYTTDTRWRPSEGHLLELYNRVAIDNYLLNKISYDRYYNFNKRILSYRTELANITSLVSGDVSDDDKFSLGGRKLRGFDVKGVGPRNSASGYIGGNNVLLAQLDYSIPLSESDDNSLDFVTFADAGKIFSNDTEPTNNNESVRISLGTGINLNTLIGPLSLTYAIPVQSESYDKEKKFVFSIGWVN